VLLALASCKGPTPPAEPAKAWQPFPLDWSQRDQWPHDTATVVVSGYVRLPLEMTTAEHLSVLELWPRRNQTVGTDLHLSIAIGDGPNQQRSLPESYADSSLHIQGNGGEDLTHQSWVRVTGHWQKGEREVLEVKRIKRMEMPELSPSQRYPTELTKKSMKNGEAEGQLVFARGVLKQPSIVLPDRDIDLVLATKGFQVTARVLMGGGPSQMRPAGSLLGQGQLMDRRGEPIKGGEVVVYGAYHDGKIYVEEMEAVAAPSAQVAKTPLPKSGVPPQQ
jgi:hypothetical protein